METDRKIMEYQEITELTPQLMKELVKKIMIRPDGSIRIEWNFRDEMNEPIPFDFDGKATPEEKAMWKKWKSFCPSIDTLVSGSPIIQNGKVIGAVTHVFVQDATKGYGIFIENMLNH